MQFARRKFAIACFCFLCCSSGRRTLLFQHVALIAGSSLAEHQRTGTSEARSGSVPLVFRRFASLLSLSALTR